jgi:hypothetical protein
LAIARVHKPMVFSFPSPLRDVNYGEFKEGLNFLVWKSYDWWR